MAPSKKSAKKNPPHATRGRAGPSPADQSRAERSLRRSSVRQSRPICGLVPTSPHPHTVTFNKRKALLGGPDPSAPTRGGKVSASRTIVSKKKKPTGHKPRRVAVAKASVRSSDEDSDYANSLTEESVDAATTLKPAPKTLFPVPGHNGRVVTSLKVNRLSYCGLVKPKASSYDSIIDFDGPLQPFLEEYKFRGNHPQCAINNPLHSHHGTIQQISQEKSNPRHPWSCRSFPC